MRHNWAFATTQREPSGHSHLSIHALFDMLEASVRCIMTTLHFSFFILFHFPQLINTFTAVLRTLILGLTYHSFFLSVPLSICLYLSVSTSNFYLPPLLQHLHCTSYYYYLLLLHLLQVTTTRYY